MSLENDEEHAEFADGQVAQILGPEDLCVVTASIDVLRHSQGPRRVARAALAPSEPPAAAVPRRAVDVVSLVPVVIEGAELGPVESGETVSQEIGFVQLGLVEVESVAAVGVGDGELLVLHEQVAAVLQLGGDPQLVALAGAQLVDLVTATATATTGYVQPSGKVKLPFELML